MWVGGCGLSLRRNVRQPKPKKTPLQVIHEDRSASKVWCCMVIDAWHGMARHGVRCSIARNVRMCTPHRSCGNAIHGTTMNA